MIWIYRFLFLPILLLSLPYYLARMLKRGGYAKDFQHRLGRHKQLPPTTQGKVRLWIQAVSVGEVNAVAPLVKKLHESGWAEVVLTTTTSTGYAIVRDKLRPYCKAIGVFPLDFLPFNALAWRRLRPDVVVLMESELWPEHCHRAKKHGVPIYLVNARMSDRSFQRYAKVGYFAQRVLSTPHKILASTEQDAQRFTQLGVPAEQVKTVGNMKFDVASNQRSDSSARTELLRELGFIHDENAPLPLVLLGSSTWPGEEALLQQVFEDILKQGMDARLLIVPRHAERRNELCAIFELQKRTWHLRSRGETPPEPVMIHIADTTGELTRLSTAADLAFIGKSLSPNEGGQTPIEAAALGIPMVYGPNMSNFKDICRSLEKEQASLRADHAEAVRAELLDLAQNTQRREQLAKAAKSWHAKHVGATDHVFETLAQEAKK